jgi:heptosyltransferase I
MHILLVKTSSLGDIIHTFPALTDAAKVIPTLKVDWVTEEAFASIAQLHPMVQQVIPVALRRWRKTPFKRQTWQEIRTFMRHLRQTKYDLIIDAQGLLKSSLLSRVAKGQRYGFDTQSAREKIASLFYQHPIFVAKNIDAIHRIRELFAKSLGYSQPHTPPQSGLLPLPVSTNRSILILHGTTWNTKKWPVSYWVGLAEILQQNGVKASIPWSTPLEHQVAQEVARTGPHITILDTMTLARLTNMLTHFKAVVTVDSGLGYLTAALGIPTFMVFGPTNPDLLGTFPSSQLNLRSTLWCSPCQSRICKNTEPTPVWPKCFAEITPETIWGKLEVLFREQ